MSDRKDPEKHIVVFSDVKIRRIFHEEAWWFSVVDIIRALTGSPNPRDYWYKMKIRVKGEDEAELSTCCRQLKLRQEGVKSEHRHFDI